MSSRRPRRQRRRPRERASTLPRPVASEAAEAANQPVGAQTPRLAANARPEHHVAADYRYVRKDLVTIALVGGLTLAFVLVAAAVS